MPTSLIRAAAIFVLAFGLSMPAAATHSWANYHWARQSNPLPLNLGDNLSAAWAPSFMDASLDWNYASVLEAKIVAGATNAKRCGGNNGRVEVCNSAYGNNGWLGIAQIWVSAGHIVQGVVKLNDTYFDAPPYDTPEWRALVMCQEVGHVFGLGHQDENFSNANLGSCMDYTNEPASNQHPNSHDYALLGEIYAHLDSYDSFVDSSAEEPPISDGPADECRGGPRKCGSGARGVAPSILDLVLSEPGQWGRLLAESSDGRRGVYELDLGDGHRVITHVFWIESRQRHSHDH
ncbi:MAG TPA: hypothetical protein VIS76_01145 [Pseudomonadales bacterium]